jgi:phage regulator Rha-like protein
MNELVTVKRDEAFTNSMIIANGTDNQHPSVMRLIKRHRRKLEKWGQVEFTDFKSINSGKGRPIKIAFLNEQQATFLVTLLDNNDKVLDFKAELVDQFFKMRKVLIEKQTAVWVETRKAGILTRRSETDVIKELIEYAKAQGSTHADMLYVTYSKLANKIAGVSKRDLASVKQLNILDELESMIYHVIKLGMAAGKHYKEIYQDCKRRLEWWQNCTFRLGA